ncbi:general secretion pathway protein GspB [Marinobacter sp. F3R08]|uniref:general secretion pathway protein GspB n=1 Tax=Marinobacter sp. F3R08 TaxID=2841559 RepID=UPI001C08FEE3|nr:general secretion pathway protein GspB [Marinobacter sp. F3R08]MBU2955658.1 general secretion pathway protein GspB [Marinobacter sp. F3R08]
MSYILDALQKSETERRQGRVPDLGQQVQLIHRPKKKGLSPAIWVALALFLNAAVLVLFVWSGAPLPWVSDEPAVAQASSEETVNVPESAPVERAPGPEPRSDSSAAGTEEIPEPATSEPATKPVVPDLSASESRERATVIVPSSVMPETTVPIVEEAQAGRVPHLVELPLSFQKSVPDLTFNSHIYSSSPASSRVMINDTYLKVGDSFEGLRVDEITEEGVVLSRDGRRFRVGVVRDWVSPR